MRVIIDTSSLEYCEKEKKDIMGLLEEYHDGNIDAYIIGGVLGEIERHSAERGVRGRTARAILSKIEGLTEQKRLKRIAEPPEYSYSVDDALIKVASEMNATILTQDKGLKMRARDIGIRTITCKRKGTIGD